MPKGLQGFQKGHKIGVGNKFMLGKKFSLEQRKKLSIAHKGLNTWMRGKKLSKEWRENIGKASLGRPVSYETRKKLSEWQNGDKSKFWKGGITKKNLHIRNSIEYKLWRESVFKRDNYLCIWGGKEHGNKLQADHIKPFSFFPELRFAIDNGRTLCVDCHKTTDTYGSKSNKLKNGFSS